MLSPLFKCSDLEWMFISLLLGAETQQSAVVHEPPVTRNALNLYETY